MSKSCIPRWSLLVCVFESPSARRPPLVSAAFQGAHSRAHHSFAPRRRTRHRPGASTFLVRCLPTLVPSMAQRLVPSQSDLPVRGVLLPALAFLRSLPHRVLVASSLFSARGRLPPGGSPREAAPSAAVTMVSRSDPIQAHAMIRLASALAALSAQAVPLSPPRFRCPHWSVSFAVHLPRVSFLVASRPQPSCSVRVLFSWRLRLLSASTVRFSGGRRAGLLLGAAPASFGVLRAVHPRGGTAIPLYSGRGRSRGGETSVRPAIVPTIPLHDGTDEHALVTEPTPRPLRILHVPLSVSILIVPTGLGVVALLVARRAQLPILWCWVHAGTTSVPTPWIRGSSQVF